MFARSLAIALAALMAASSVQAGEAASAQLQSLTGQALVSQAKGLGDAHAGAKLASGDRLMVKTGQASLRYADGCTVTLKAGSMATIGAKSPCAGGAGLVSANPVEAEQFGFFKHITPGGVVAGLGTVLLVGAVLDGIANADSRCNTFVDTTCESATSP